jgi:L-lactate dehydrogenase complex protein LldF
MSVRVGNTDRAPAFPLALRDALRNDQLRRNVRNATDTIRTKRAFRVEEMPDWRQLRQAASDIKSHTLEHLDYDLEQFERNCEQAGGKVHRARDPDEANTVATTLIKQYIGDQSAEVIKVMTMTSDEIQMNVALERDGIRFGETDLADMIVQMSDDEPSHIVVHALHKSHFEVREMGFVSFNAEAEQYLCASVLRPSLSAEFLRNRCDQRISTLFLFCP